MSNSKPVLYSELKVMACTSRIEEAHISSVTILLQRFCS